MPESPLTPQLRMPAILRFRQESQDQVPDPRSVLPQHIGDSAALCEFCGEAGRPFPDISNLSSTAGLEFCCSQARHLVEALVQEWRLLLEMLGQGDDRVLGAAHPPTEEEEVQHKALEREERRQQERDLEQYYQAANSTILPADSSTPQTKTISFQLSSCLPQEVGRELSQDSKMEEDLESREGHVLAGPGVFGFGITHKKDSKGFREKYYSHGNKFLTVFPDGSTQVFYPSGQLALLIAVGDGQEDMVCIVQDDHVPVPPIRALFQSNGRATCYHSNGSIWVSIDISGGQCLDERGARTRRWRWGEHQDTPTPLRPLFLSLNQSVGVRVLGQERMFVTFLARGCQARFSVGSCVQDASSSVPPRGPSISREEVFLLAGRVGLHQALGRLHHCLRFPSNPRLPKARPAPSLVSLAKALLALSRSLQMEERDRAFILACLQDCL
ncbi:glutamate-rich protein 6 [Megalops cyprinoides]|uniref:glutamate-rich protein 6 n=1 Tax=Megalops cyprinoides TaxID=118141 RepID=UPI0018642AAC|nr:glutamate-rich protein 6 [Megalops cyprinoides]